MCKAGSLTVWALLLRWCRCSWTQSRCGCGSSSVGAGTLAPPLPSVTPAATGCLGTAAATIAGGVIVICAVVFQVTQPNSQPTRLLRSGSSDVGVGRDVDVGEGSDAGHLDAARQGDPDRVAEGRIEAE